MGVRTAVIAGKTDSAEDFRLAATGLWVPSSQINGRTGVTSLPVLTATGNFTCTVGPFSCVIDGTSNSLQGVYWATLDTATTVTLNAANTQARIDLISLQIQDNAYDGSGQNRGQILYTAGTPGSGVAPSAPANSISLFTVPVAANATSANFAGATAVFPYTAAAGGIVPVRSSSDRPAVANSVQYRHRLDVAGTAGTTSPLEWSLDGTTWRPVFDTSVVPASTTSAITAAAGYGSWTNTTVGSLMNVNVQTQYRTAPGNRIELRGGLVTNSATPTNYGTIGNLPAPSADRYISLATWSVSPHFYLFLGSGTTTAQVRTDGTNIPSLVPLGFDGMSYSL